MIIDAARAAVERHPGAVRQALVVLPAAVRVRKGLSGVFALWMERYSMTIVLYHTVNVLEALHVQGDTSEW